MIQLWKAFPNKSSGSVVRVQAALVSKQKAGWAIANFNLLFLEQGQFTEPMTKFESWSTPVFTRAQIPFSIAGEVTLTVPSSQWLQLCLWRLLPARRGVWASPHKAARSAVAMATARPRPGRMVSNSPAEGLNSQLCILFALYERGTWSKCPSSAYLGTSATFDMQIWIQILQLCSAFYKITGTRTRLVVLLQSHWFCQEHSARICSFEFSNSCPFQKFLFI